MSKPTQKDLLEVALQKLMLANPATMLPLNNWQKTGFRSVDTDTTGKGIIHVEKGKSDLSETGAVTILRRSRRGVRIL